ncbi:hypothetical protein SAMN04489737_0213 [Arcanobacterium phocae]|uniref:Very-short-patch-repair endonuclease n=2 Tax=Arcanobacterium phocae TaxID=131112 RepID=A0A1H2LAD2_9ACTO|nr:hypothetical protein [Arcanobacterium phocae]SDU77879.1 hypothetical protein SAMN04489737_0213 [Arcanobacterium phocae]
MHVFRRNSREAQQIAGPHSFRICLETKKIIPVGHRWYATEPVVGQTKVACENGLLIGCLTAIKEYGGWVPYTKNTHYIANKYGPAMHLSNAIVHRCMTKSAVAAHVPPAQAPHLVVPLTDAIEQVLQHHDAETGLVVLDSLLNQHKITSHVADIMISRTQSQKQRILKRYTADSQSGSETRVRNYLLSKKYLVATQVPVEGVGRVDLLVGQSLIIECDSSTFHSQPIDVMRDRERDLQAKLRGYSVLRLSYEHVWHRWPETQRIIDTFLHTGEHRMPPVSVLNGQNLVQRNGSTL